MRHTLAAILFIVVYLLAIPFFGFAYAADEIPFSGPNRIAANPTPRPQATAPSPTTKPKPSPTTATSPSVSPTLEISKTPVTPTSAPPSPFPTEILTSNGSVTSSTPTPTSEPVVQAAQVTIQPTNVIIVTPDVMTQSDPPSAISYAAHTPALESLANSAYNTLIKPPLSLFPFPTLGNYYSQQSLPTTTTIALLLTSAVSVCGGLFLVKPRFGHL